MGFLRDAKAANAAHRAARVGPAPRSLSADVWPIVVQGCRLVGGHGFDLVAPSAYNIYFDEESLVIALMAKPDVGVATLAYDGVASLEVGGRGRRQKGGGFIGGGFGVEGAAEGMLAAGVLNALTSGSDIETWIRVQGDSGELIFFYDQETPDALRIRLSAASGSIGRQQRGASGSQGVAGELAQLAALRESGALTDEEFARAKQRVLDART